MVHRVNPFRKRNLKKFWEILEMQCSCTSLIDKKHLFPILLFGPRQANLVFIAYASSEGRSLARTSAAHSYKKWVKRNLQPESQIPGPSEWLGMRN